MPAFYGSKEWDLKRKKILRRDKYLDQYMLRQGVRVEAKLVHHILPKEEYPEYQLKDWNLISVSEATHKQILHEKFTGNLTKAGRMLAEETALKHGIKLRTTIMVIGLPGTGKSTWAKKNLGGGVCYDLDAIAAAFRLTTPHKEEDHSASRRMAAALRSGFIQLAPKYANRIIIVRTAPQIDELVETMPDELIICEKVYEERKIKFDLEEYRERIDAAIKWAKVNSVPVRYIPPRGP